MTGAAVLVGRGIEHSFGDVHALRGVDVDVHAGEIVAMLGPNGAGKTTLVRVIATLLRPDAGEVVVCSENAATDPAAVRSHLGLAGQFASVDELLTGRENLELIGRLYGIGAAECRDRAGELLVALGLADAGDRRAGSYSGGMRRRLDLGATLIGEPSLLLLDEPTNGLDPRSRVELWEMIRAIAARGTAVLLTSQNLQEVERLADRVIVLDEGVVIADDQPAALQRQIGGHVIDVRIDAGSVEEAARVLQKSAIGSRVDVGWDRVTAQTTAGLAGAVDAAHDLVGAGLEPSEFALRNPSLEEAFLTLTGAGIKSKIESDGAGDDRPIELDVLAERPRPVLTRSILRDVAVVTGRDWKRLLRTPESIFYAAVQPVLFVLGLAAVFGRLVETVVGVDYIQFLLPGVVVMQVALAAGATGVGMATDLRDGIIDRFRSLPMAPLAVLAGRTTTDLIRNAVAVATMIVAGFAIGFRLEAGVARGIAGVAVALLFGYAITWVFAAVGLAVKDPQAATFLGFAPVLLFVYLSSAWVPIETMNGAVRGFARNQPVNVTIEAVRGLVNGTGGTARVVQSLAWSVAIIAVFGLLATRQFRRATA